MLYSQLVYDKEAKEFLVYVSVNAIILDPELNKPNLFCKLADWETCFDNGGNERLIAFEKDPINLIEIQNVFGDEIRLGHATEYDPDYQTLIGLTEEEKQISRKQILDENIKWIFDTLAEKDYIEILDMRYYHKTTLIGELRERCQDYFRITHLEYYVIHDRVFLYDDEFSSLGRVKICPSTIEGLKRMLSWSKYNEN